jgi:endonuclease/exonuclease/phosphatase family protein
MKFEDKILRLSCAAIVLMGLAGCGGEPPSDTSFATGAQAACGGRCVERQGPEVLEYEELVALSVIDGVLDGDRYRLAADAPALEDALNHLLFEPFISNEAFYDGVTPHRPKDPAVGKSLRAAQWNIERGQELALIEETFAAAADPAAREAFFRDRVRAAAIGQTGQRGELERQLDALGNLDVLVLNEVDLGMKRSGYAPVADQLAKALGMNYAYAVEFVEVDPIALGRETFVREDFLPADGNSGALIDDGTVPDAELAALAAKANELEAVDPARSRNIHGNAILSRYPIVSWKEVRLQPRKGCWDWNANEQIPKDIAGRGMDYLAEKIFLQKSMRELRHGGRVMLMVDLFVPGVSADGTTMQYVDGERGSIVTVVNAHLEAKSTPQCRREQMKEVLEQLEGIENPVILAGDLNTVGTDGRPMTVERLLLGRFHDPQWIFQQMVGRLLPYSGWAFMARDAFNWIRLKDDPTGLSIPLLLPNPERGLFDAVEGFAFADGGRFDFRGDSSRTVNGTEKTLANSNQRDGKGFKTSFAFTRDLGINGLSIYGRFKLDWMFVRGYARSPRDARASYRMAPHFAQTLEELRDATEPRLSDHAAMVVALPLGDPCPEKTCQSDPDGALQYGDDTWTDVYEE